MLSIFACLSALGVILEARDEGNTGLPIGCLLIQIILQSGISVAGEPKMKIQDPISKQTLMKSSAQLRRNEQDDNVPPPPPILVGILDVASSSQTVRPPQPDVSYSQIMEALAAIQQLSTSSMQQSISVMQQDVHSINLCVEQNQLDLRECLQFHHPSSRDDEDDAPMANAS
jgi:hypothetical protein